MELTDHIRVTRVDKVFLYECHQPRIEGTLVVSSYNLIFSQSVGPTIADLESGRTNPKQDNADQGNFSGEAASQPPAKPKEIWVSWSFISRLEEEETHSRG